MAALPFVCGGGTGLQSTLQLAQVVYAKNLNPEAQAHINSKLAGSSWGMNPNNSSHAIPRVPIFIHNRVPSFHSSHFPVPQDSKSIDSTYIGPQNV